MLLRCLMQLPRFSNCSFSDICSVGPRMFGVAWACGLGALESHGRPRFNKPPEPLLVCYWLTRRQSDACRSMISASRTQECSDCLAEAPRIWEPCPLFRNAIFGCFQTADSEREPVPRPHVSIDHGPRCVNVNPAIGK